MSQLTNQIGPFSRDFGTLFVKSARAFGAVRAPRLAAALAFYTILSLSPMLIVVVGLTQLVIDSESVRELIVTQTDSLIGPEVAATLDPILNSASESSSGVGTTILGTVILLFGASGVFTQLQDILNRIWRVELTRKSPWQVLQERLFGVLMVLLAGIVLLLLLISNTILQAMARYFPEIPFTESFDVIARLQLLLNIVLLVTIFALLFRFIPQTFIAWRDVGIGALVTAFLFSVGLQGISFYLSVSTVASAFGAAGSLLITLLATYYAAQIFLFGAQFTQVYSQSRFGYSGKRIREQAASEA